MARGVEVAGKVMSVRGLKRKEIKVLKKKGFYLNNLKIEQIDDALDLVFGMLFSKKDIELIEDSTYAVGNRVWMAILKETFGAEDEEKNLPKSGTGSQTKKE